KSTTRTVSGAWAAGVAEDTRCLPAVGRELVPPDSTGGSRPGRPPPSAPVGSRQLPSAPVSSRLTIRSGLDARPGRGILAPMLTHPAFLFTYGNRPTGCHGRAA